MKNVPRRRLRSYCVLQLSGKVAKCTPVSDLMFQWYSRFARQIYRWALDQLLNNILDATTSRLSRPGIPECVVTLAMCIYRTHCTEVSLKSGSDRSIKLQTYALSQTIDLAIVKHTVSDSRYNLVLELIKLLNPRLRMRMLDRRWGLETRL